MNLLKGQSPSISDAIKAINANARYKYSDDNIDTITWLDGTTAISKSDIETKLNDLRTQWNAKKYARDRKGAILNAATAAGEDMFAIQLDKLWHDINDGKLDKTGSFYAYIKGIKDANAKP
jgi:hypothetical protein